MVPGTLLKTYTVALNPYFVFDGQFWWVTRHDRHHVALEGVYMYDRQFNLLKSWINPSWKGNNSITGITFDGQHLWIAVETNAFIHCVDRRTMESLKNWSFTPDPTGYVDGVATDGQYLYLVDYWSMTISKWTKTGVLLKSWDISAITNDPIGLTFDGQYFYLSDWVAGAGIHMLNRNMELIKNIVPEGNPAMRGIEVIGSTIYLGEKDATNGVTTTSDLYLLSRV